MSSAGSIVRFFSVMAFQIPMLIVCLAAIIMILSRRKQGGPGLSWALMGFGLAFFLCLATPISQTVLVSWVTRGGSGSMSDRSIVFGVFTVVSTLLHAVSYALLAMAVFVGSRSRG